MNKRSRRSLLLAIVGMTIVGAFLVIYFNYAQAVVGSQNANLAANSYTVGTDYTGIITQQFVHPGQQVHPGQKLFYIKSAALIQSLQSHTISTDQLLYSLTRDDQIIIQASKPGLVQTIDYTLGSFVPANKEIATIVDTSSTQVNATFKLNPRQYKQIGSNTQLTIILPDNSRLYAPVSNITITPENGSILTTVQGTVHAGSGLSRLTSIQGTPVTVSMQLSNNLLWNRLVNELTHLRHSVHF
jgi:multidrug resistance efflux pump